MLFLLVTPSALLPPGPAMLTIPGYDAEAPALMGGDRRPLASTTVRP